MISKKDVLFALDKRIKILMEDPHIHPSSRADRLKEIKVLRNEIESLPDDQPAGESYYPGSYYQPLFDHMSQNHNLTLLQVDMDEIIRVVRNMDEPALLPFQWPIPDGMDVVTRDGRKVGQLVKMESGQSDKTKVEEQLRSLVGVLDGQIHTWFSHGNCARCYDGTQHSYESDLFLRRKEKKVWVVEWSDAEGNEHSQIFNEINQAFNAKKTLNLDTPIYEAALKPVL